MIIHSDWHIHSEYSYDAKNPLETIAQNAINQGLYQVGITDHLNYNDESFTQDLKRSAAAVNKLREKYPFMVLGVELTPMELPEYNYIKKHGVRDGYVPPNEGTPYEIELAYTKEELMALGVKYAVGASHWRVDLPGSKKFPPDLDACIREWYRQQLWLAGDERVTILGHPWYHGKSIWYEDFSVIPASMNDEIMSALKENGKYAECNSHFFLTNNATEKFKQQYADFLMEMFERGIPITYGSDAHFEYEDMRPDIEKYLSKAGFKDGDFSEISEKDFWTI